MSRTRSRDADCNFPGYGTVSGVGTTDRTYGNNLPYAPGYKDTMTDSVTPGYFSTMRSGGSLPVNHMSQKKYDLSYSSDSMEQRFYNSAHSPNDLRATLTFEGNLACMAYASGTYYYSNPFSKRATTPSWPSSAAVLQEALANANSARFDLMTFAAEFGKTNDLVSRAGNRTLRRAHDIRDTMNRRYRRAERTYDLFANLWLEYRYGWRILMFDIEAASESIARLNEGISLIDRFSAYREEQTTFSESKSVTLQRWPNLMYYSGSWFDNVDYSVQQVYTRSAKAGVAVKHFGQDMYMSDPFVTAYELIPFSFIADWFFTIGDAVKAHSPFASTNLEWAYVTTNDSWTTVGSASMPGTIASNSLYSGLGADSVEGEVISNSSFTAVYSNKVRAPDTPSIALEYELNLDYAKVTDLLALVPVFGKIIKGSFFNSATKPIRV